jgi:hypothetical protein
LTFDGSVLYAVGGQISANFIGSATGYTQGAIILSSGTSDSPSARGQGVFLFNEGTDTTWYAGSPYTQGDAYIIARKASTTSYDGAAAQYVNALITIDNAGKVGIGTSSPGYKLEVSGNAKVTGELVVAKSGTDSLITFPAQTNDPGFIKHYESSNTAVMYFSVSDDDNITGDYFAFGAGGTYRTIIYTNGRIDAAILYDYNNTGYYLDPASTSNLNVVRTQQVLTPNHSLSSVYGSFNTTTTNGYLITTNISYNVFNMPTVIIEGYAYGGSQSINLQIVWYAYNDSFINQSYVNNGDWDPGTIRIGENGSGKVCIHLSSNIYYGRFNVRCIYDQGFAPLEGWSITDATYTGLSRLVTIGKSAINTSITGLAASETLQTVTNRGNTTTNNILFSNYGVGIVGTYSDTRYQAVFAMGDSYKLPSDGTGVGTLYGIAWSHPNNGGAAANLASHGMLILENGVFKGAWGGGSLRTPSDVRGTIFYDYDDTSYYCNPNSYSSLYTARFWGGAVYIRGGSPTLYLTDTDHMSAMIHCNSDLLYILRGGVDSTDWVQISGSWPQYWNLSNNYTLMGGIAEAVTDFRAPIFYDSNDTTYYLNPAGTSNLNSVYTNFVSTQNGYWHYADTDRNPGSSTYYPNTWSTGVRFSFASAGNTGTGGNYSGVLHFHPWTGTTASTGDASYQLVFGSTAVNGSGYPQLVIRNGIDTTWNSWYYIPMYGLNQYAGALYATIYYDSTNTAYYLDPASTSRLATTITTTTYFGSTTSHGYAEEYGTYSSSLRRIAFMSFDWNANYNSYNYHGIASTDLNGTFSDSMSINSFNDINLRVDANNNNGASYVRFHNNSDVANQFAYIGYDGTNYLSYFTGTGYFTGDVIAYYSDARLKENVRPIDSVIEKISKIGGYYYTPNALALQLNAASDINQKLGVLAQEIEKVFPEAVEKAPFDRDENGNSKSGEDYLTVKYERLVPVLIEAIKEQQKQIEELKYLIKNK